MRSAMQAWICVTCGVQYPYDRIYSLSQGKVTATDGAAALERSAERYLTHR